jgi:hypothetical protein
MSMASMARATGEHAVGVRPLLPRWRDVLREQFHVIGLALRIPMLLALAFGAGITLLLVMVAARGNWPPGIHAEPIELPGIAGALFPLFVWAREERFGPGFFRTLPVDHGRHVLARIVAGWLWLMVGVALFSLAVVVITLVAGGSLAPVETIHVLDAPLASAGPVDAAMLRRETWAPGLTIWAVPFTAATAGYALVSAVVIGLRYPVRWAVGAAVLFVGLSALSDAASRLLGIDALADAPARAIEFLCVSRYGVDAVLTMRTMTLDRRMELASGETLHVWSAVPHLGDWAIATVLWTGAGLLALLAALSRHRERRRR